jgi:hypothetical protein
LHRGPDSLEDVLDLESGLSKSLQQLSGKHAIGSWRTVIGDVARTRGVRNERSERCLHERETALGTAESAGEGCVPTRIEDDDVDAALGSVHLTEDTIDIEGLGTDVILAPDLGTRRNEIIPPVHLYAVARIVEEPDATLAHPFSEVRDRTPHAGVVEVHQLDHVKTLGAEHLGHSAGVVNRITQRGLDIGRVTDDEGSAMLSLGLESDVP